MGMTALFASSVAPAFAAPAKIIILRHGEKADSWKLCPTGDARAEALVGRYLGKDAADSLFAAGEPPAAFVAITLHTLELVSPAAASWGMPVILFSALPGDKKKAFKAVLNTRTQEAAQSVLTDGRYAGRTVVMAWEHDHIADEKLEREFSGEQVTLRQLLGLGTLDGVPMTWPGSTYDYFWIVEFDPASGKPTSFRMQQQVFPGNADVPQNAWGAPQKLPSDCIQ